MKTHRIVLLLSTLTVMTAIVMGAVQFLLIQGVSQGANKLDDAKTQQAVAAMIAGINDQMCGLMIDNAKWDDAVTHVYGPKEDQWLFDTWGYSTADQNYDVSFLIDDFGNTVAGFSDGEALHTDARSFFGPEFEQLMAGLPKDNTTFAVVTSLLETPKGVAAVAVAPILPYSEDVAIPTNRPRLLVFSKTLTTKLLASMGDRLVVNGLSIVSNRPDSAPAVALDAFDGSVIGYLAWTPDRPGDKAKSAIQIPAILSIGGMIACMVFMTGFSGRLSSRLQKSERQAWFMAYRDTLTSLPNRHAAVARLDEKLSGLEHSTTDELVVMLADLDGFKDVNDSFGHHVGDQLLRGIAAGLEVITKNFSASICRLGGDEFAIIVDGKDSKRRAIDISRASLDFLAKPFDIDGRSVVIGVSVGLAGSIDRTITSSELMRRADVAMYVAKERGKNQFCEYRPELDELRNSRAVMADQLEKALAAEEIEVVFQPIVNARSLRVTGVEALARWQQPAGEWVPPDEFIKVAEQFGQIDRLGSQVLAIACREAVSWSEITLSVNVSPVQFKNPAFVENVLAIADSQGFPHERLELEVTEGCLIEHHDRVKPIIEKLQNAGVHVSLDDFGTGYSSIAYLRQYHFDKVKIDRSLIREMIKDSSARNIIQATAALAQSLNMTVTAEGVEREDEIPILRLVGCHTLQGYYFGRPQSARSITALVASQHAAQAVA